MNTKIEYKWTKNEDMNIPDNNYECETTTVVKKKGMIKLIQYDDKTIDEIIKNIDLLEYTEQSLDFEQDGKNYFTNCPLHIDLTPSLSITPEKNLFYCFSCGIGGTIVNWLMKIEGLEYEEAIAKAASLANIDLSKMCQSQTVKFLRKCSKQAKKETVKEREILDKLVLNQYTKGEIPEWIEEGIPQDILDLYEIMIDTRGNRIIYPVYTLDNQLINIKGRTRHKEYKKMKIKKYINYYKIGAMDYFQGLNISIKDVIECGEIIIFESLKSCMKLRKYGRKNSASAEKHSLTDEQIELLIKLKVDVVLAYDSDVSLKEMIDNIDKLKRFTNVYVMIDEELLGGKQAKNSPIDLGYDIFEQMYNNKKKII